MQPVKIYFTKSFSNKLSKLFSKETIKPVETRFESERIQGFQDSFSFADFTKTFTYDSFLAKDFISFEIASLILLSDSTVKFNNYGRFKFTDINAVIEIKSKIYNLVNSGADFYTITDVDSDVITTLSIEFLLSNGYTALMIPE